MENSNLNNEQFTNPLLNPLSHSIEELLKEIQFGRPAETQLQIQKWIDELTQEKLLGKTISKEVADKDSFEKYVPDSARWTIKEIFKDGVFWQMKRSYSEQELKEIVYHMVGELAKTNNMTFNGAILDELFKQFKKK